MKLTHLTFFFQEMLNYIKNTFKINVNCEILNEFDDRSDRYLINDETLFGKINDDFRPQDILIDSKKKFN